MMKIVYHRSALRDLEAIHSYIARDNPDAANRVIARIKQATLRLERVSFSGRPGPRGIRLLSVTGLPYIVIHRIRDDTIRACGASPTARLGLELHVDHIIPWSNGGDTVEDNLQTLAKLAILEKAISFDRYWCGFL